MILMQHFQRYVLFDVSLVPKCVCIIFSLLALVLTFIQLCSEGSI